MTTKNNIPLTLTTQQRELLFKYIHLLKDEEITQLLTIALKKDDKYEIYLAEEQIEDLCETLFSIATDEVDHQLQSDLDDLEDYIDDIHLKYMNDENSEVSQNTGNVYVVKVTFEDNKKIWRKIAIRGGQTLHDLHDIIFEAFDREEEHLYSFYIPSPFNKSKSKRVILRSSMEYTHPFNLEGSFIFDTEPENAQTSQIETLNLVEKQKLLYLFDFGDEWWHEITVENIDYGVADEDDYPRVIEKKGDSPVQCEWEEE